MAPRLREAGRVTVARAAANHWIVIRTSAPDSALPAEGQRVTPCYAGVASLPGRPPYSCTHASNVMAKVQIQTGGDGPFQFAAGANYYRLLGLEITRPAGTPGSGGLVSIAGVRAAPWITWWWIAPGCMEAVRMRLTSACA